MRTEADNKSRHATYNSLSITDIYERVSFLINLLSSIERQLFVIADKVDLSQIDPSEAIKFFNRTLNLYNTSLELIRKILIYFPSEDFESLAQIAPLYSSLTPEQKQKVLSYIQSIAKGEEES